MALQVPCTGQELINEVNNITDILNIKNGAIPIEVGGTGANNVNDALANLGGAKIATGSYVGTDSLDVDLTFDFKPKLLIISGKGMNLVYGTICLPYGSRENKGSIFHFENIAWHENSVSWYADLAFCAANMSGDTYHYVAIG